MYVMIWFMNYASTVGYTDMQVYNNWERLFLIFAIYVGDALLAIGFGMMASQSQIIPERYIELFL